jgi:hypothetical protein
MMVAEKGRRASRLRRTLFVKIALLSPLAAALGSRQVVV